ncbi:MAG TPA: hypothetical protein GXX23_04930 [Firmicutes bacterium]|nr:hypothetical protein [Candidatus Fermentithermobacillaceae bacterium]
MSGKGPFDACGLEDIERKLAEVVARVENKKSLERKLQRARQELDSERARLAGLAAEMAREQKDVARLEGVSLAGLFYAVLGDRSARIDKEREEYLRAKLRHDQAEQAVKQLEADVRDLSDRVAACGDPEAELDALLKAKERFLVAEGSPIASELLGLEEEKGRARALGKELREAIAAGENVHAGLKEVLNSLGSAQNWGVWDMLGGGLIATAAKHSHLDRARDQVHHVQDLMNRFRRELADVAGCLPNIEIGGFARFADYFFDGLLVDWMVQSKINESAERTRQQVSNVEAVLSSLRARLRHTESTLERLDAKKQAILLKPTGE